MRFTEYRTRYHSSQLDADVQCVTDCTATDPLASAKIGPNDFEILRVVGQGAFGKVFQVRQNLPAAISSSAKCASSC